MDDELASIGELIDAYIRNVEEQGDCYADLTKTEILEIDKKNAASEFVSFRAHLDPRIDTYDCFLYWLDANYPFLYEEHRHEIWSQIRG